MVNTKNRREYFVALTSQDFGYAKRLAEEKYKFSRKEGHTDRMKGSVDHLILTDARAIMAERAVGRVMGWKWKRTINGAGQPDFIVDGMKVDVKSTIREFPSLKIPCYNETDGIKNNKMDRFILVSVSPNNDYVVIRGWIDKHEAIRRGTVGRRQSGFYWEVYHKYLEFMEDW
ncbi:hypothetical protein [Caudoviricetes sp.]|nr:hypothetical protein [Caudoviricetes sp.]UOF79134.1 hypothetical protein [Caudoviricetes sp.]